MAIFLETALNFLEEEFQKYDLQTKFLYKFCKSFLTFMAESIYKFRDLINSFFFEHTTFDDRYLQIHDLIKFLTNIGNKVSHISIIILKRSKNY